MMLISEAGLVVLCIGCFALGILFGWLFKEKSK